MKFCLSGSANALIKVLVVAVMIACNMASASVETLRQAESLINSGHYADARKVLAPLEAQYLGDPRYDYLLGLALLETGEPGLASLAFERAIATDPRFAGARLDLARAYYASGAYGDAQRELEALRDENPPPTARQAIDEYLALIANRQRRLRLEYRLGTQAGYDSNANSATAVNSFLGFDLVEQSRETASSFAGINGSFVMLKPLSAKLLLDTRLGVGARSNPDASFVNSRNADISVGIRHVKEGATRSLRLRGYQVEVDGNTNSEGLSLTGSWEFKFREKLRLGVFGQAGQVKYGDSLQIKDANQYLLGASANWTFGTGQRGSLGGSLVLGMDDPLRSESRYARDVYGLRFNAGWSFNSQFKAQFTAGLLQADYDVIFFEQQFDSPRSDTLTQASVKLDWRISENWLMSHVVAYTHNDTDIDIFAFERVETSLSFNRVWR